MNIILADDMDGIEAARIIYSTLNIPVLYLTGQTDDDFLNAPRSPKLSHIS